MVGKSDIHSAIRALGLEGHPLCVHASLRSFGGLEGGGDMLLDALLEVGCTVLVPSFSHELELPPPEGRLLPRNGMDEKDLTLLASHTPGAPYAPGCGVLSPSMGAFSRTLLSRPGSVRGDHPLNSFAALGPEADALLSGQTGERVYAPFEALCARNGYVLLMGVGLDRATIVHYGEQLAGRALFLRWALDREGVLRPVRTGGCSRGFGRLEPTVAPLARSVRVGDSLWQCFPAAELARRCAGAIRQNPELTRCDDPCCIRCADAATGGPALFTLRIPHMDLDQIAASGQCFTWKRLGPGRYAISTLGRMVEAAQEGDCFTFSCTEAEFRSVWADYFDLGTDYGAVKAAIDPSDSFLTDAAAYGGGIRILRQDLWEVMVSFLISQNNNMTRITRSVAALRETYGQDGAFPRPDDLADAAEAELEAMGLGYRAKYLSTLAESMSSGALEELEAALGDADDTEAAAILTGLYGIGKKVADCILLFGLHRMDAFPLDTHIKQILTRHYPGGFPFTRYRGCAGILQQYLFYSCFKKG